MKVELLVSKLKSLQVHLGLEDGRLKVNAPKGVLNSDLVQQLKESKEEIIKFLSYHASYDTYQQIEPVAVKEYYPVSHAQKRLWILSQIDEDQVAYNIPLHFVFQGELDTVIVGKAFEDILQRHEILRTTFCVFEGEPLQRIVQVADCPFEVQYYDLREDHDRDAVVQRMAHEDMHELFDLQKGPLLRVKLLQTQKEKYIFLMNMHHIISDEWSTQILFREIITLYNERAANSPATLAPLKIQYKDFAAWQNTLLASNKLAHEKSFWISHFEGVLPLLELPVDRPRPAPKTYRGRQIGALLDASVVKELTQLNKDYNGSMFMTLLATVNVFLYKYTNQKDIILGTPIAGRSHPDLDGQIGYYSNTLGIRTIIHEQERVIDLLSRIRTTVLNVFEHQTYPFDRLIDDLNLKRDVSRSPLFDVAIVLQKEEVVEGTSDGLSGVSVYYYPNTVSVSKFDLTFHFIERGDKLTLILIYNTDLFEHDRIQAMLAYYRQLLGDFLSDRHKPVQELTFLAKDDVNQLLYRYNPPAAAYPADETIHGLLEAQVRRTPEAVAVRCGATSLTYASLNEKSNKLAHFLRERYAVKSDALIGVLMDRSEWMIISIMAVLKAGAAYVPIDPEYPADRVRFMLEDSDLTAVLVDKEYSRFEVVMSQAAIVHVGDLWQEVETSPASNPVRINASSDLAYIIYTSGSTGRPKGVMIEHRNVTRLLFNDSFCFDFSEKDCWTLFHSICFDFSVWEIFGALLYGGKLIVVPKSVAQDPAEFAALLETENVTVLNQIPTVFGNLLQQLEQEPAPRKLNLRYVIFGGEALKPSMLSWWHQTYPQTKLVNMYGITETTVHVTYKEISDKEIEEGISNIGTPIPTLNLYVMNEFLQLLPPGVEGELIVGGEGVARGYLNRDDLTSQRFKMNPYRPEERIYLSGDLGIRLASGDIKYTGRKDMQVKVRGFRIELGEIENALLQHAQIENVVVVDRKDDNNNNQLLAYFRSKDDITTGELREHIQHLLPEYMIPAYFIRMASFPLNANGKVERKALPEPQGWNTLSDVYVAPRTATEKAMVSVWEEELKVTPVGITSNFFALGGDSLKAIRLITKLKKQTGLEIKVADLFRTPTIEQLSKQGEPGEETIEKQLEAGRRILFEFRNKIESHIADRHINVPAYEDIYPFTPIESGLIYSSLLNLDQPVYYDQFVYNLSIRDIHIFQQAISMQVQRHNMLRTRYYLSTFNQAAKLICASIEIPFLLEDISAHTAEEQRTLIKRYMTEDLAIRLSFEGDLLWRMKAFHLGNQSYFLCWSFHHAMLDGWSVANFATELSQWLSDPGTLLPPLVHSYKDYCAIVHGKNTSGTIRDAWKNKLQDYSRNKLPFNYSGKQKSDASGVRIVYRMFNPALLEKIQTLATTYNVSFKAVCLTAHVLLMHVICSENDVVTGVVTHDRPEIEDGDTMIGCFLNTLPVRIKIQDNNTALDLIRNVYQYMVDIKPMEMHLTDIAKAIGEKTSIQNPLFDTLLNYTDFHVLKSWKENATLSSHHSAVSLDPGIRPSEMTNTLFDVEVSKTLDTFTGRIKFWSAYFEEGDVVKALDLYERILTLFTTDIQWNLSQSKVMSEAEREEVIGRFNDTRVPYSKEKTLHQLFEEQAQRTPGLTALKQHGKTISYQELDERSNQVARLLVQRGVRNGDHVGILTSRSFDMIYGMYGILKAGASYVPVDPEYPIERQQYILSNSSVTAVVTDDVYPVQQHPESQFHFILLNPEQLTGISTRSLGIQKSSSDLAYTIYTSGSTGRPKGVMIEHHSAVNLVEWVNREFAVGEQDRLLFITSMCFDLSVYDIFGMLATGGCIVIAKQEEVQNVSSLKDLLLREKITFWDSVPTTINYLIGELEESKESLQLADLRLVFMSGDWIPVQLPDRIKKYAPQASVISLGGATEGTVWSNFFPIEVVHGKWASIPYGKPLANNFFYMLDDNGDPVIRGVVGELYIGGIGVARGYANDATKTAAAFKEDPFHADCGGMMYKTGDLGRMMSDGNMEFIGRKDHQTKIRGYRVELGEIESQLSLHDHVKEAAVAVYKEGSHNALCAYVVAKDAVAVAELKEYLGQKLPSYMVPAFFIFLDRLPLNSNGKLNRQQLPVPDKALTTAGDFAEARDLLEEKLSTMWQNILGRPRISIHDNFLDLGAHSLNIGAFVNRVQRDVAVAISIRDVFMRPTIAEIAAFIREQEQQSMVAIESLPAGPYYEVSHAQRRLWLLDQITENQVGYNMPAAYVFQGNVSVSNLSNAFEALIQRHEILRTVFRNVDGQLRQVVIEYTNAQANLNFRDARAEQNAEEYVKTIIREETEKSFDLSRGPLIRMNMIQLSDQLFVFVFTMHHIISDGWSMGVLVREIVTLYNAFSEGQKNPLEPLRIQYKDYAAWQNRQLTGNQLQTHRRYWMDLFKSGVPVIQLPYDHTRPAIKTYRGSQVNFKLGEDLMMDIDQLIRKQEGSLFMFLLASVHLFLHKITAQQEIVIGTPVAGRDHAELENQIGFYVNTLPLRNRINPELSFEELFRNIKESTLLALAHQVYPFDTLVDELDGTRDNSRSPLFDVLIVLQNAQPAGETTGMTGLNASPFPIASQSSKFDLTFNFSQTQGVVYCELEYNVDLFDKSSVQLFKEQFLSLVKEIVSRPQVAVQSIAMFGEQAQNKKSLTFDFD